MQKYTVFIGIDISKCWFDACLCWTDLGDSAPHARFDNTTKGFTAFLKWVGQQVKEHQLVGDWYFCMEHTGIYSLALTRFLEQAQHTVVMECPVHISKSVGLRRGKSDSADAAAIAQYAERFHQHIKVRPMYCDQLLKVQALLSLRARLVRFGQGLQVPAKELKGFVPDHISQTVLAHTLAVYQPMQDKIRELDKCIKKLLCSDKDLRELYWLVHSVKGIGPVTTAYLLVYTNGFTAFKNARQFACYIGVVPFHFSSGSSVRKPDKVNQFANKKIKALLSTAAISAMQWDPQLKAYAEKQLERGKNLGWVLNALKNKIVHRVFAVVKRGSPYVTLGQHKV